MTNQSRRGCSWGTGLPSPARSSPCSSGVAIIGAGGIDVLFKPGTSPARVLDAYAGHSSAYAWAAGWFRVVLLGRALFAVAVRRGLISSGLQDASAGFAVLAMTAGVVFETVAYPTRR
jgi:hypothetical protein